MLFRSTILIGVANNLQDAKQFKAHYKTNWIQVGDCYVTGIDEEIKKYWKDKEAYYDYIKNVIEKEPVPAEVSGQILRQFQPIAYEDRMLIILTFKNMGNPVAYDSIFYERHGSHNSIIELNTPQFYDLIKRTTKKDT